MNILEARKLNKWYYSVENENRTHAVSDVSFSLKKGEFLGLVGESGCGKSTIAKMLAGLQSPDSGEIILEGKPLSIPYCKSVYKKLQMVFQMPQESFDPRKTVGKSLIEIQRNFGMNKHDARIHSEYLLGQVGLSKDFIPRYPYELSGGECQRVAIARALSVSPQIIICDEITSALDVSVQAQIIELLQDLRKELNLSLFFISHDLSLVQGFCDRIMVMYNGNIVEEGTGEKLLTQSQNKYTRELFSSIFDIKDEINNANV